MYEFCIRGATIIDGTGAPPFSGSLAVKNGKIAAVGACPLEALHTIDATGLFLAPGFIDPHTHADLEAVRNKQQAHALTQGITTQLVGLCGLGFAPMSREQVAQSILFNAGIFGTLPADDPLWEDFYSYHRRLEGAGTNLAAAVTHNALRTAVAGFESRTLTEDELCAMEDKLREAMQQGAVGFSTGLSYYPCAWSDTQELIRLCRVVKEQDGVFLVHKRLLVDNLSFEDDAEIVKVIEATGVRTHLLHYKTGLSNAGDPDSMLRPYEKLLNQGAPITFELYPYTTGSGYGLVFLPPWAQEGGFQATMDRLGDPALRTRLLADIQRCYNIYKPQDGAPCVFSRLKNLSAFEGLSFERVAALRGQGMAEMLLSVLWECQLEFGWRGSEPLDGATRETLYRDMLSLFQHPLYTIGSDSIPLGSHPNPRLFGAFSRIIRMTRESGGSLEQCIYKLSGFTAKLLGLSDRGVLEPGMAADLILFDPRSFGDRATFSEPLLSSVGMRYVFVNGQLAVRDGQVTSVLNGQALSPQ